MIKNKEYQMVLVDKKILGGGLALLIVGIVLTVSISNTMPIGQSGMTEEEAIDLMIAQQENEDYTTLSGILIGVGFLLILISFGARRKKGSAKKRKKSQQNSSLDFELKILRLKSKKRHIIITR